MKTILFEQAFLFLNDAEACKVGGRKYRVYKLVTEYDHDGSPYIAIISDDGDSVEHICRDRNERVLITPSGALEFVVTSDAGYTYFIDIVPLFEKRYTA